MKITDLCAEFVRLEFTDEPEGKRQSYRIVPSIAEAQGLLLVCPGCFKKNGNTIVGTHSLLLWSRSRGAPDGISPGPGRWTFHGTGLHDLTLHGDPLGSARSVDAGCWHGFIDNGDAHE